MATKHSLSMGKIIKQGRRRTQIRNCGVDVDGFLRSPNGFKLISRFCYNTSTVEITILNVSLLHCRAISFGMTENVSTFNLLEQTQIFLEGASHIFYKNQKADFGG
ncbi:hypothetical protein U1Q18_012113 [Sarracenia purpurea var. burkii]